MKKTILILFILLLLVAEMPLAAKIKKKDLADKYRHWLDEVEYIITKEERGTFFKLTNDRDRDVFIRLFWNLRDPTPGTEVNEFKDEHFRRFQYANKYFKYGAPREGWKTDMGRIYIILGEPSSKEKYDMDNIVVPTEIWSYYGIKRPGLPGSFWIVFWKKHGMGEYKIYEPATDGPNSLLRKTKDTIDVDPTNYEAGFEIIQNEHPLLARASLSLIPDESPANFTPSLRSQLLLDKVIALPKSRINDTYATNFLKYKGRVEVDYSINFVESKSQAMVVKDAATGLNFVHFTIRPKNLSAQASGEDNRYYFNFDLAVSLYQGNKPVFEYHKNFPYSGDREEVLKTFYNSMIISDYFPVAEGEYRLSVLLQNRVNKEFTYFDRNISVPAAAPAKPVISGLLLSKEVKKLQRQVYLPFKFRELEVTPVPDKEFGKEEKITAVLTLERGQYRKAIDGVIEVKNLTDETKYSKQYPFKLAADPNLNVNLYTLSQELERMAPGYYTLALRLNSPDGTPLAEKTERFTISFRQQVPGITHLFKTASAGNRFVYYHILGLQYQRLNLLDKAEHFFNTALNMRPGYGRLVKDFCSLLLKRKKFDRVLELADSLKTGQKDQFDYHAFRGKALFFKAQYNEAVKHLTEANRIYDSDISVLNYLGFSYLKTGNKSEARKVFTASLRLNDQQKEIAAVLKGI
jgi:GWxTD domain-containing protein